MVLASLGIAASLTVLPMLRIPARGWAVLGGAAVSLFALLAIVRGLYSSGVWLPIAIAAVCFGLLLVFAPIALRRIPMPWRAHRTAIALGLDTAGLLVLLAIVFGVQGRLDLWPGSVPFVAVGAALAWGIGLILRYLPVAGLYRAAAAIAFGAGYLAVLGPVLAGLGAEGPAWDPVDLAVWHGDVLAGNVQLLVVLGLLLVAVVLAVAAALRRPRSRR